MLYGIYYTDTKGFSHYLAKDGRVHVYTTTEHAREAVESIKKQIKSDLVATREISVPIMKIFTVTKTIPNLITTEKRFRMEQILETIKVCAIGSGIYSKEEL